ncbi:MAG: hypothetical protein F6K48_26830 [Okeania sp. SIO3H1]|nr:hypothetical protein [Okeania sp. SIO3H1]
MILILIIEESTNPCPSPTHPRDFQEGRQEGNLGGLSQEERKKKKQ